MRSFRTIKFFCSLSINHKAASVNLVSWAPETVAWIGLVRIILDFEILKAEERTGWEKST